MTDLSLATTIAISGFVSLTFGILAYFAGAWLTQRYRVLSAYSIPEPVTGGLAAAVLVLVIYLVTGREISFDLGARDALLVYFFTTIGLNARLDDLKRGGPVLGIMLALTIVFMIIQAAVGLGSAWLFGLPPAAGVMLGTASLVGGHGTSIAWGPTIAGVYGVTGAAELGIAMATVGLIVASLMGGPIAKFLIFRHALTPPHEADELVSTAALPDPMADDAVTHIALMRSILWMNVAVGIGYFVHGILTEAGVKLPLFVPCLIAGIVLSNSLPQMFPRLVWPANTRTMAVISEFSLSVFLSMSLMSMALWTLASSAAVLVATILLQSTAAALFIIFVIFPALGRNYFAAVMAAGSAGLMIGATPTAIANMSAVTQRYGPAPLAFIVLPLVSAFFVDIANAFVIQGFLRFFGGL
jgi:ESS family glutamate:Na+ symporter